MTAHVPFSGLPDFEGDHVDFSYAKLVVPRVDLDLRTFAIDQFLDFTAVGRIGRIEYNVNKRTGKLERNHVVNIEDVEVRQGPRPLPRRPPLELR